MTSRKDEISFHETSERNTWRFPSWRHHAPPLFLSFATFEAAVGRKLEYFFGYHLLGHTLLQYFESIPDSVSLIFLTSLLNGHCRFEESSNIILPNKSIRSQQQRKDNEGDNKEEGKSNKTFARREGRVGRKSKLTN